MKKSKSKASEEEIKKEIDKVKQQIQSANTNIKQTEKLLDVDLFLKQQKQKRLEYAKELNSTYEEQKKIREAKLYKKHNREKKAGEGKIQFKTQNIRSLMPLDIVKVMSNERKDKKWLKEGHHYTLQSISKWEVQSLREEEQKMFSTLQHNPQTDKLKYDGDTEAKHIVWKNAKEVVENCMEIKCLPITIVEGSLLPSSESENLMNALLLLTEQASQRIFHDNEDVFIGQLYGCGRPISIFTDKYILVREFAHKNVNIGSRSYDKNVIWPTMIEKAYKKMKIYDQSPPSSSFTSIHEIFGVDAEFIPITNKNLIKENFSTVLAHTLQEGKVAFMSINHNKTIFSNRFYLLESVRQEKEECKFKIKNPWRGNLIEGKNLNEFTILQLMQLFNVLIIYRDYPKKWKRLRINISYFSNGAVGLSSNEWTKNPQYLFTITRTSAIRIVLRKSGADLESSKDQSPIIFGFLLFENKEADNKISCMKMDMLVTKTKSNDLNGASYVGQLIKGNYILIPYCTKQSETSYQFYVADFIIEREENIHFGKTRYFDYHYKAKGSRLNNEEKVVQSLESVQLFDKPKVEQLDLPRYFKPKLVKESIQRLKLNLYKNAKINHFFLPGFVHNLLINKEIEVPIKTNMKANTVQHQELTEEERAQSLSTLLGYDALDEDINQGKMKNIIDQSVGSFDFSDFGLGQQGLTPILECLSQQPQIISLDLRGNNLGDTSVTYLCYYLEKSDRVQVRKLDVRRNEFTKVGKKALEGLKSKFPKIEIIGPGFVIE